MKKIIVFGSLIAMAAPCWAATDIADPNTVVTTATIIASSVTGLGLLLLGWRVGSRMIARYLK
jgi:hypothetical protein